MHNDTYSVHKHGLVLWRACLLTSKAFCNIYPPLLTGANCPPFSPPGGAGPPSPPASKMAPVPPGSTHTPSTLSVTLPPELIVSPHQKIRSSGNLLNLRILIHLNLFVHWSRFKCCFYIQYHFIQIYFIFFVLTSSMYTNRNYTTINASWTLLWLLSP
jgi:hypothetical protein